jgi:hypothetical protein
MYGKVTCLNKHYFMSMSQYVDEYKGGYTLATLPHTAIPYRDRVDRTCAHITHQELVKQ